MKILVVGGLSRAALAFRRSLATSLEFSRTSLERQAFEPIGPETVVEVADLFNPPAELFDGLDVVVNFAGITHGRDVPLLDRVNVKGPQQLAAHARKAGVRHFVQLSSLHVYGYAEEVTRATPEAPVTPYGRSKCNADLALLAMQSDAFTVSTLRMPMLYGGGTGDNLRKLARLMARIGVLAVPRTGTKRSILHVDNLAVLLQTLVRGCIPGISFGADPELFTLDTLADVIDEVSGRRPRLLRLPDVAFLPLRVASRGLYAKLYQSNYVRQDCCLTPYAPFPVLQRLGLADMLSKELGRS